MGEGNTGPLSDFITAGYPGRGFAWNDVMKSFRNCCFCFTMITCVLVFAEDQASPVFSLGLENLDFDAKPNFRLFPELTAVEESSGFRLPTQTDYALIFSAEASYVPEHMQMNLKPRTWGDYDVWEKAGFILAQTGAIAGAAYMAYRVVD